MHYGSDALLKRLFSEAVISDFKIKKLAEVLEAILDENTERPVSISIDANEVVKSISSVKVKAAAATAGKPGTTRWSVTMDEVETALYNQWKPLYVEMMELSAKVGDVAREGLTDPYKKVMAGQMALRILDLDDLCEDFYDQRDYYITHGKMIESKPYGEPCMDAGLMPLALSNSERYLRDYKKKLEKDPSNVNNAKQLQKHQWFVDYYKKVLKKN